MAVAPVTSRPVVPNNSHSGATNVLVASVADPLSSSGTCVGREVMRKGNTCPLRCLLVTPPDVLIAANNRLEVLPSSMGLKMDGVSLQEVVDGSHPSLALRGTQQTCSNSATFDTKVAVPSARDEADGRPVLEAKVLLSTHKAFTAIVVAEVNLHANPEGFQEEKASIRGGSAGVSCKCCCLLRMNAIYAGT